MRSNHVKLLSGISLAVMMQCALAGTITNVSATNLDENKKLVTITFDGDPGTPYGFVTDTPNRITLDFKGAGVRLQTNSLSVNDNILSGIRVSGDKSRARVAFDLNMPAVYRTQIQGNSVMVYVSKAEAAAEPYVSKESSPRISVDVPGNRPVVTNRAGSVMDYAMEMKFKSPGTGAADIEVNVPNEHNPATVSRGRNSLVVTFPGLGVSRQSVKKYDVEGFQTAVRLIEVAQSGNDSQLIVHLKSGWDFETSDLGNKYIVSIKNASDFFNNLDEKEQPKSFSGKRLTLDFERVDIRTLLSILAKESGLNIVADSGVAGEMTLQLKDIPWDQALDLILESQDLEMRRNGNLVTIARRQDFEKRDDAKAERVRKERENGPLYTRTYQLKYKSVDDFKTMLQSVQSGTMRGGTISNSMLSNNGSLMIDGGTNTLIVTDISSVLDKFERLVKQMDVSVPQVMIEARIVEVTETYGRQLGLKLGTQFDKLNADGTKYWGVAGPGGYTVDFEGGGKEGGAKTMKVTAPATPNIDLGIADAPTAALSYILAKGSDLLSLELQAMQSENQGRIISSPRVLTQDRQQAKLEEGQEMIINQYENGSLTQKTVEAKTVLDVKPQITPDGNVIMDIQINKDSFATGGSNPVKNVKSVTTKAMVENGGTMVVGGMYSEETGTDTKKIPLLGDIPVVGNLFKNHQRRSSKREMLIFITPRILNGSGTTTLNY